MSCSPSYYTFRNKDGQTIQLRGDLTMGDLVRMGYSDIRLAKPETPPPTKNLSPANPMNKQPKSSASVTSVCVPPLSQGSPSDFLRLGLPRCSIFGETWHEMTAVVYLQALVVEGDKWQPLTPNQVREAVKKLPPGTLGGGSGSVLANVARLQLVADKLTSADDARAFSPAWRMKRENDKSEAPSHE